MSAYFFSFPESVIEESFYYSMSMNFSIFKSFIFSLRYFNLSKKAWTFTKSAYMYFMIIILLIPKMLKFYNYSVTYVSYSKGFMILKKLLSIISASSKNKSLIYARERLIYAYRQFSFNYIDYLYAAMEEIKSLLLINLFP